MTLAQFLTRYRPEPSDGRGETWAEHHAYLRAEDSPYLTQIMLQLRMRGRWFGDPAVVDGDVAQDGHHRAVAAMALGWHDLEIPVTETERAN